MSKFTPQFLDRIRDNVTLSDIIRQRMKLTRAGREFKGCCPFHKEKTPSFYVNDDKQFYHCFGCGAHGDAIRFIVEHDNVPFPEAVEQLADKAGVAMPVERQQTAAGPEEPPNTRGAADSGCRRMPRSYCQPPALRRCLLAARPP
ncbi:MAG: CHC2 zinc finger domain-containing protein, partial [Pseudomonadota bacterium]|nr:CHC2 zinc finger domain-containing protein [Pseudomonadota bacterium]